MRIYALGAACLLVVSLTATASAQEGDAPNPIDVLLDAFDSPVGQEFTAQFVRQPTPGVASIMDPIGDFEHSTGEEPGFTPDHLDITDAWALEFDPGPIDLFAPTNTSRIWAPTGRFEVDPPNHDPFYTFTGDQVHDGGQYASGAILFGFTLVDTPPVDATGRCEYVVWVNDLERGNTFVNNPSFPRDPAGGTNLAFGLGLNPQDGPGAQSGFMLELQDTGGFAPNLEADIRGFITPRYVGVTVPRELVGVLGAINFYTFCVEEGFGFEPDVSGADQTGLIDVTADDLGVLRVEVAQVQPETTTTTQPVTTTTEAPVETTPTLATEGEGAGEEADVFPWWFVVIAGGLGLALAGWWLYSRDDDPCQKLLEAWMAAERACDEAQQAADEAADECEAAELELEGLEEERREACRAWPPACWDTEEGDWIEDDKGNRITSRDIHMRKMALGEVWSDYKAGKLTATEVEAKWREMDTPEFREELRDTDEAFDQLLEEIDSEIADTERRLEEKCKVAAQAQKAAEKACAASAEAKAAYERCVGQAMAASAASDVERGGEMSGADTSLSGGTKETASDPCQGDVGKRELRSGGNPDPIRVYVDFSVITSVASGSERNVDAGRQLVLDLNDLARDLDFAGDLLNARSAGLHIGGAINGYAPGRYVVTGTGLVRGAVDATMATSDIVPDIPSTPVQAGLEGLETLARLGSVIAGKVTDWMTDLQVMTVRLTKFYQNITATPYEIWECRQDQGWVCIERIWEIEVSKLKSLRGRDRQFTVNSDVRRREFERAIRRQAQQAASIIKRDAQALARWRAEHEAGPCR